MYTNRAWKKTWRAAFLCIVSCFGLTMTNAVASRGMAPDRRITFPEAVHLAERAIKDASVTIVINDKVLMQLNHYLGTPDGRAYMRNALDRMETHRETIEKKLAEYGAPKALLAVPLVESGYRNLAQSTNSKAAGVWQVIESTASHYGMRVDGKVDERLDVESESDAAIRYLMANNFRFRDWGLSLLAYNTGARTVQNGIDATGSRNPWVLIQAGYENDKDYLSKVLAAIIIMYNPSSLDPP